MRSLVVALSIVVLTCVPSSAQWRQFRGPNANGVAEAANLPVEFSETNNLRWRAALPGPGASSPIVLGDRVFVTCFTGYGVDADAAPNDLVRHLVCVSLTDGTIQWSTPIKNEATPTRYGGYLRDHGYASSTPVTDGKFIFVFAGKSGVYAFDLEGKQRWRRSVGTESAMNNWGSAASPIVYNGKVIVNANAESSKIYALNAEDGEVAWEATASSAYGSWATPVVAKGEGDSVELLINVPYEVWSMNPDDGSLNWYAEATSRGPVNPTVVVQDGIVYALGSRGGGSVAIKMGGKDDISKTNIRWKAQANSYVPSPIVHGKYLYVISDSGIATCLNTSDGEEVYQSRLDGAGGRSAVYASPVLADGKIYVTTRRNGVVVLAAGGEFKQLARNVFAEDKSLFNGSPAVVDDTLLIRSDKYLYRIGK
ncbi:MAG: PQQ-binding-like beta-propeller repeat protein [Pirellulaceae bacterium]